MNEDVNIKKNDENIDGKNKESEKLMKDGHLIKEESEFDDPDELFKELINKIYQYHPSTDISLIQKAYDTAFEAHKDQKRKSGEPYIIHPVAVAIILAELEMDKETIAAGLLHDVVEDTAMSYLELKLWKLTYSKLLCNFTLDESGCCLKTIHTFFYLSIRKKR